MEKDLAIKKKKASDVQEVNESQKPHAQENPHIPTACAMVAMVKSKQNHSTKKVSEESLPGGEWDTMERRHCSISQLECWSQGNIYLSSHMSDLCSYCSKLYHQTGVRAQCHRTPCIRNLFEKKDVILYAILFLHLLY